jgi:hypothetical protein
MRILDIVTDPSRAPNPQLDQHSRCAHCNRTYVFRRGILAKLEHEMQVLERDEDGYRYPKRGVGVYAYHSVECFLAIVHPVGHA